MFGKAKNFLLSEDRGVSPVIGVILMVAITVILAAVIATFVMNMGPSEQTQPSVQWEWNNETDYITLDHTGGDAADPGNLVIQNSSEEWNIGDTASSDLPDELSAGDTLYLNHSSSPSGTPYLDEVGFPNESTNIQLVWENPESDQTQVISDFDG